MVDILEKSVYINIASANPNAIVYFDSRILQSSQPLKICHLLL